MTFARFNDVAAALTEARAAEEASRMSAAALHRSAVAMHEEAHAAAVANVRRQLIALGDALAELWAVELVRRGLTGETMPIEPSQSGEWLAKAILRAVPYSLGGRRLRGRVTGLAKRIAESTLAGLRPVERHYWMPGPSFMIRLRDAARRDKTFAEQNPGRRFWVRRAAVAEAEFARRAIRRFNPGDAEPVMAVRRDLSGRPCALSGLAPESEGPGENHRIRGGLDLGAGA